ncbi:MAG: hypothetical protein RBG13Loki_1279 [Promethearchaeota archaeon CR_4]|nr:MAG: hypothetical protein RBG13Loki_1279 [Candidatus Lokiarchaeota archaeon CR_4]
MGKSSKEKFDLVEQLLQEGKPYRVIQEKLLEKFGSGMSNTTLKRLLNEQNKIHQLEEKNMQLEHELALFKKMYFELLNATRKSLAAKNKPKSENPLNQNSPASGKGNEKFCTLCGASYPPNAKYCPICGQTLY